MNEPPNMTAAKPEGTGEAAGDGKALRTADSSALAAEINAEHQAAFGKAREALEHARKAGELLLQAKAAVGHGKWLPWVEAHCAFGARQAQRYISLAENWSALESKYDPKSHLTLSGALALLVDEPPEEIARQQSALGHDRKLGIAEPTARTSTTAKINDIKVMPQGYWRSNHDVQPQLLANLLECWAESSDFTRREFFLILHGRDEFMPVVNGATVDKEAAA